MSESADRNIWEILQGGDAVRDLQTTAADRASGGVEGVHNEMLTISSWVFIILCETMWNIVLRARWARARVRVAAM